MAQVNSSPGQNQAFGNVAVSAATAEVGSTTATKTIATNTVVKYTQSEPGKTPGPSNTVRS
jgi:hypothetical protein